MFSEYFSRLESLALPLGAMVFFFAVFLVVLGRACSRRRRRDDATLAALPLADGAGPLDRSTADSEVKP